MPTQMLYDLAQAAKMAAMDWYGLEQCAAFPEVLSVPFSRETFDVALHIRETVVHKLEADGLSQRWTLTAVECGSHRIPSHEPPGTVQAITYSVTFTQLSEGSESHTVSGTLTVLTA